MTVRRRQAVTGTFAVDGDKSISHRALLIGAIAQGSTRISNLLASQDCLSTRRAIEKLGVPVREDGNDVLVDGSGLFGLSASPSPIDCGNSGTTMRLLAGILAGQSFESTLTGDESLSRRPMDRIIEPLRRMGARVEGSADSKPPIHLKGGPLHGEDHSLRIASAQVKSCLLLAGLLATGSTSVAEPAASRDHTERMLRSFGVRVDSRGNVHRVEGRQQPIARPVRVPADLSSAAFFTVAALLLEGSNVLFPAVGTNRTRAGVLEVLEAMGGRLERRGEREIGCEPVADLRAVSSPLRSTEIAGELIPRLIDEIPVLAVAATQAAGTTVVRNAAELRVKETDRIAAVVSELSKMGARIEAQPDGMTIKGPVSLNGARLESHGDHRVAMALAVAGAVAKGETTIRGAECIGISFPGFARLLSKFAEVSERDG